MNKKMMSALQPLILESLNKKTRQEIELLLVNPNFNKDVGAIRRQFRTTIKVAVGAREGLFAAIGGKTKAELRVLSKQSTRSELRILNDSAFQKQRDDLGLRYRLRPKERWEVVLNYYILYGEIMAPFAMSNREFEFFFDGKSVAQTNFKPDEIKISLHNFDVAIKHSPDPRLYIEIFQDTSADDVKNGWGVVDEIRKAVLGKKRFYPLKSLALEKQILSTDAKKTKVSDWEKQQKIFGEAKGRGWGKKETRRRRVIKQTRSRYKKRFKPKS